MASRVEPKLALAQERFFSRLLGQDSRISLHLGRLERRQLTNPAALELRELIGGLPSGLDPLLRAAMDDLAERAAKYTVMVEKAVDVQIAIDMVIMAERQEFDVAYLLTADSDLAPAVSFVRSLGPRVYVVSPLNPGQLGAAATDFIRPRRPWFEGLFDAHGRHGD